MTQNKAAQDLANLTEATRGTQDQAARIAATDAERGTSFARRGLDRDGDGESEFALPEALATTVAAGWLLGPVGGLALGIAQGIYTKQQKQNALDEYVREQDAISGVQETLNGQFDQLLDGATNDNDREQLGALRTQQDGAFRMMLSGNPELEQKGSELLATVQGEVNAYTTRQESQRIEAEANDAQMRRELDQERYTRFTGLQDDFTSESTSFEEVRSQVNVAKEALERGTPADLHAALIGINKALDPTSVVREEEATAFARMGNLWDKGTSIIQQYVGSGQQATPEMRRDLLALLGTIDKNSTSLQLARETRYSEQLDLAGFDIRKPTDSKYYDQFRLVDSVPAYQQQGLQNEQTTTEGVTGTLDDHILSPAVDAIDRALEADQRRFTDMFEWIDNQTKDARETAAKEMENFNDAVSGSPNAWPRNRRTNQ